MAPSTVQSTAEFDFVGEFWPRTHLAVATPAAVDWKHSTIISTDSCRRALRQDGIEGAVETRPSSRWSVLYSNNPHLLRPETLCSRAECDVVRSQAWVGVLARHGRIASIAAQPGIPR